MSGGWVKVHRKILENPVVFKDSDHLAVWMYLLLNATHKSIPMMFGKTKIELQAGQLIVSANTIAKSLSVSESKVRRCIKTFKNDEQIDEQATRNGRLITILKWSEYQSSDEQNDEQVTNRRRTSDEQVTPNKNVKNERMKECKNTTTTSSRESEKDLEVVIERWNELGLTQVRSIKAGTKRYENLQARIREYGIDDVLKAINAVRESNYLQGDNPRGWQIDLGWMVLPDKFPKVLEGQYANRSRGTVKARSKHDSSFDEDHKPMFRRSI